jgi:aminoglycoside 3-N-acetyltransferase
MELTREEIVAGLRALGVEPGMVLMVHSSLSAFGRVAGGADTVIEALLEVVGPEGTLMMPAMGGAAIFDVEATPSNVGTITDVFWRRPDVTRSIHPTHSVAGRGPLVDELIAGHLDQPSAIGPDSPWGKIARRADGYLLFLGVDQDRNTLLHTAEDIMDGAYLKPLVRDYYDEQRRVKTLIMERFPGPHRDFIGLDHLFFEAGAMVMGKIGGAVCRLMKAADILRLAVEALDRDPAAVLCDNPHCEDCVKQRAAIKCDRLAQEDFTLSAVLDDIPSPLALEQALWDIQAEGLQTLEIGAQYAEALSADQKALADLAERLAAAECRVAVWPCAIPWQTKDLKACRAALEAAFAPAALLGASHLKLSPWLPAEGQQNKLQGAAVESLKALAEVAGQAGFTLLIENHPAAVWYDHDSCAEILRSVDHPALRFSFNPAHFAHLGEHPFLRTWSRGKLKRFTVQLMLADGCGRPGWPAYTVPGQGQGEVQEIISILRCRSFAGWLTLTTSGSRDFTLPEAAAGFWKLLDTL